MQIKNIFTIDVEDWFHANYENGLFHNHSNMISTVEANVDRILEIFELYQVKATFFVLGSIARQHSKMIIKIAEQGHEIASHGYGHLLVYEQTPEEFREDVLKSKMILEDLTGRKVTGYRAPSWSITEQSVWALDLLEELGFRYSSSIFPTRNYLYGISYAPRFIHGCNIYGKKDFQLLNIPPSTKKLRSDKILGGGLPFSGGAYFRLLPYRLIKRFTDEINRKEKQPVVFYLHPREIDIKQPRLKLKMRDYLIHYYGIRNCEKKLIKILNEYKFETIASMLNREDERLHKTGDVHEGVSNHSSL